MDDGPVFSLGPRGWVAKSSRAAADSLEAIRADAVSALSDLKRRAAEIYEAHGDEIDAGSETVDMDAVGDASQLIAAIDAAIAAIGG